MFRVYGLEVVAQRGILQEDTSLGCEAVDVVHQTVHVGKLHRGTEELPVASLQAREQKQCLAFLGAEPKLNRVNSPSTPPNHPPTPHGGQ